VCYYYEAMSVDVELHCKRCGHRWAPRGSRTPVRCPKCQSPYWQNERSRERTSRSAAGTLIDSLIRDLVSLLREIPEVQAARAKTEEDVAYVTTYLDQKPWDRELAYRVYEAELAAWRRHPDVAADFRLVNLAEYAEQQRPYLQNRGKLVYSRVS
jgi:hypothetical protein